MLFLQSEDICMECFDQSICSMLMSMIDFRRKPSPNPALQIQDVSRLPHATFARHDASLHPLRETLSFEPRMLFRSQRRPFERGRFDVQLIDGGAAAESDRHPGNCGHLQTALPRSSRFHRVPASIRYVDSSRRESEWRS